MVNTQRGNFEKKMVKGITIRGIYMFGMTKVPRKKEVLSWQYLKEMWRIMRLWKRTAEFVILVFWVSLFVLAFSSWLMVTAQRLALSLPQLVTWLWHKRCEDLLMQPNTRPPQICSSVNLCTIRQKNGSGCYLFLAKTTGQPQTPRARYWGSLAGHSPCSSSGQGFGQTDKPWSHLCAPAPSDSYLPSFTHDRM